MDGSLYLCEMPFDPDHASACHASTAAASVNSEKSCASAEDRSGGCLLESSS